MKAKITKVALLIIGAFLIGAGIYVTEKQPNELITTSLAYTAKNPYIEDKQEFSINPPEGWKVINRFNDKGKRDGLLAVFQKYDDNNRGVALISIHHRGDRKLDELENVIRQETAYSNGTCSDKEIINTNNVFIECLVPTKPAIEGAISLIKVKSVYLLVEKDSISYALIGRAHPDLAVQFNELIKNSVRSFKVF